MSNYAGNEMPRPISGSHLVNLLSLIDSDSQDFIGLEDPPGEPQISLGRGGISLSTSFSQTHYRSGLYAVGDCQERVPAPT
jgi:hypothetical protein